MHSDDFFYVQGIYLSQIYHQEGLIKFSPQISHIKKLPNIPKIFSYSDLDYLFVLVWGSEKCIITLL